MEEYDDIDLRPYIRAVARRWYLIVAGALLAAAIMAGVSTTLPKSFTATSSVLLFIRQTGSQVGMNEAIVSIETIDISARRQGLLALIESSNIETQIPPADLQRIAPAGYQPGMLTEQIETRADGDLVTILASAPSPQAAQALADVWAKTFVAYSQTLYTDQHSEVQLAGTALLPTAPSEPQVARNAIFAGLIGGALAAVLVLAWELVNSARAGSGQRAGRIGAARAGSYPDGQAITRRSSSQPRSDQTNETTA